MVCERAAQLQHPAGSGEAFGLNSAEFQHPNPAGDKLCTLPAWHLKPHQLESMLPSGDSSSRSEPTSLVTHVAHPWCSLLSCLFERKARIPELGSANHRLTDLAASPDSPRRCSSKDARLTRKRPRGGHTARMFASRPRQS